MYICRELAFDSIPLANWFKIAVILRALVVRALVELKLIAYSVIIEMIKSSEYGSDLHFPRARASEYSAERG